MDCIWSGDSTETNDFRTYFKFHLSPSGKIKRLDIGQAG